MNKINMSLVAAILLLSDSTTLAVSSQQPYNLTLQSLSPLVKAEGDSDFSALKTHFSLMD